MLWTSLAHDLREWRTWYFFRRPALWLLALFCAALALLNQTGFFARVPAAGLAPFLSQRVCVTAIVDDQPDQRPTGCVFSARMETVTLVSSTPTITRSISDHILIQAMGLTNLSIVPGDRVRACGSLRRPQTPDIPGVFDYGTFLANRDVHAILYTGARSLRSWGDSGRFRLQRLGWRIKKRIIHRFEKSLPPNEAAVMAGLVVGQRPRFNPAIKDMFLRSGTMHVLVASGSNVAFVMLLWFVAMRCLRCPSRWALASSIFPIWAYTLISGGDAPIVRAAIMGSTLVISHLLRRWDKPFNALGVAAWIILLANPRTLFDVGFQMSFVTVLGLMLFMPSVEHGLGKASPVVKWPVRVLAACATAQIWLIPVSLHSFHHIYLWSIISNMVVVPAAGIGLPIGVALAVWGGAGPIVTGYAHALLWLVQSMADHLGARTWIAPLPALTVTGYYLFLLSIIRVRAATLARVGAVVGIVAMGAGLLLARLDHAPPSPLTITWIDTGRAVATLIENAQHERFLYLPENAGSDSNLERTVLPFLTAERRRPLFALLAESTATLSSRMGLELIRSCDVSTTSVCRNPVIWVEGQGHSALLASTLSLRVQRMLLTQLKTRPEVIAARFPPRWKWDEEFVRRCRPDLIVDIGNPRGDAAPTTPWPDVPVVMAQKRGWYKWTSGQGQTNRHRRAKPADKRNDISKKRNL